MVDWLFIILALVSGSALIAYYQSKFDSICESVWPSRANKPEWVRLEKPCKMVRWAAYILLIGGFMGLAAFRDGDETGRLVAIGAAVAGFVLWQGANAALWWPLAKHARLNRKRRDARRQRENLRRRKQEGPVE